MTKLQEVERKIAHMRHVISEQRLGGLLLRGSDWFSWATAGGSNVVLQTTAHGVADVFVTPDRAYVLTDRIEQSRLGAEEVPSTYELWAHPWQDGSRREELIKDHLKGLPLASDAPGPHEMHLPDTLRSFRLSLQPEEIERYEQLGRDAATAMSFVLSIAKPEWTEFELAAESARALWARGIHPALILTAGHERIERYRHPTPSAAKVGERAMLVFCARRHGLFANLTRFVYFRQPTKAEILAKSAVAEVEAAGLAACVPGAQLSQIYQKMCHTYDDLGRAGAYDDHHQGGTTGYLARDQVATPTSTATLPDNVAVAWNPSLPGSKIEDTILCTRGATKILTEDDSWPVFTCKGRQRPDLLVRP